MDEQKVKEAYKELVKIVGEPYVSMDKEDLMPYARDEVSQAFRTYKADLVVAPGTVSEIQEILRLCNRIKLPVYPYAYGVSISSTALPRVGGLMLVVRRLDNILEINEETHTATIEPGVTWSKLFLEIQGRNPGTPYELFRKPARCPNVDRKIELAGTFDIAFIDVDLHDDNGIARIGVIRGIPAELSYPPH